MTHTIEINGKNCSLSLVEVSENSSIFTFNFLSLDEYEMSFDNMCLLLKSLLESKMIEENNIKNIFYLLKGNDREDVDKKTDIFLEILGDTWEVKIDKDPETFIQGGPSYTNVNTNSLIINKKEVTEQNIISNIKFCFNCGLENNNYKFCPSCGTNLKQE